MQSAWINKTRKCSSLGNFIKNFLFDHFLEMIARAELVLLHKNHFLGLLKLRTTINI